MQNQLSAIHRRFEKTAKKEHWERLKTLLFSEDKESVVQGMNLLETLDEPTELTSAEQLESKEKVELLKDLIKNLPTQEKKILMLYYYEELRLSEIAKIFSLTEGRISQILSQSILSLKAKFKSIN